ncbi:MAG: Gfo/Idh/MocA family oxidoreductase [Synoicihabitans sp.]
MAPSTPTRRSFLKSILAAGVAPLVLPARLFGANAPSKQITMGFIGVGVHGRRVNLTSFLSEPDCRVLAVCDAYFDRRQIARKDVNARYGNTDCTTIADFRDLLARDDLDAVAISTPDHWHVPMTEMALDAGKMVFCEKPTLTIDEGRRLANRVKRTGAVFCTGLEDRSVMHYFMMAQAVRNGAIGELKHIQVGLPAKPIYAHQDPAPLPPGFDFNMWLGPAPERDYTPQLTDPQVWRQIRDFSGGSLTDWGAHLIDTAQVGNFSEHTTPVSVSGRGVIPPDSINTVPQTYTIDYTYANGVTMQVVSDQPSIRFEGTEGWVGNTGWRGKLEASDMEIYRREYEPAADRIWPRPRTEHRNFLDVAKGEAEPIYDAESLHQLSTVMHMGAISMELNRPLKWNPKKERFNKRQANALRSRKSRQWSRA